MTPINEFLANLRCLDLKLWADGNTLRYSAPKETLTPALLTQLRERKAEILAFLQKNNTAANFNLPPILPVIRDRNLPLSFAQQRLWFLDQVEPGKSIYCIAAVYELTGSLNVTALEQSLNELVQRHEILRTTFPTVDGQPVQIISPETALTLPLINLQELPANQREAEAKRQAIQEAQRPFDLAQGPLFRVKLLRLTEHQHVLLLNMHHIISDGWSFDVSFRELTTLYEAFASDQPSPLPELPIQYADFAIWQRDWLQGDVLLSQLDYWKQQLGEDLPVFQLPTDHPRPPVKTYQGAHQSLELPKDLTKALKALSQQEGVTLFMTLLAAFQTLLSRYSGQSDIIVGTPIAGHNQVETEGLIGFFVNTLVLRTDLSGNPSFLKLLSRVREVALGAYAHQDLPFEKLVEELQPERDQSRTPLFQVMFVLQKSSRQASEFQGLTLTLLEVHSGTAKFDLTLELQETSEGIRGWLEYNTDLFEHSTIARMAGHFQILLEGIVADPKQSLSNLPLLTAAEQHQLLVEWNNTQTDYPQNKCIHQLFEDQVDRTPDAVAVVFVDAQSAASPKVNQQLTYRELNARANQLAHYLQTLGVNSEVLVGLCVERSLEMVVGMLGILKAGGAYVPLDSTYPQERLAFMLSDAQVPVVLSQQRLVEKLPKSRATVVCLDSDWSVIDHESEENSTSSITADNLAYVIYTSGSTGKPKGVAVPHRAINRLVFNANYVQLKPSDRVAQASNASFDAATFEICGALLHGAQLIGITQDIVLSPQDFATHIREQKISVLFLTTALFNQLASTVPQAFQNLQHLLFGGEAVNPKWVKEVLKNGFTQRLLHVYGPTENTTFSSWYLVQDVPQGAMTIPIGRPISNTQIYLLDQNLQPVPIGVPGELYIGGDGLARGYLNIPDLTKEKFIPNPFSDEPGTRLYKTDDLARYLADGNIEFLGRLDNQVKIRGFRIETGEIEAVLLEHPQVQSVIVTTWEDAPNDKRLIAYVVPNPKQAPTFSELRSFLKKKLPDYMIPAAFVLLDTLPLTPNGKVDQRALLPPSQIRPAFSGGFMAPQSIVEHLLTQIWEELLNIQPIGIQDNFFELGGHSLLAVGMMHQIEQVCGYKLPLSTLFAEATIEHLAKVLLQQEKRDFRSPVVEIQSGGSKRPFFFLHGVLHGGGFYCLNLARYLGKDQPFYALHPHGLNGEQIPFTIQAMAADRLETLRAIQPKGPYLLGGFCNGALVAFEMAQQLQSQGEKVDLLILIDASAANTRLRALYSFFSGFGYWLGFGTEEQLSFLVRLRNYIIRWQRFSQLSINEQITLVLKKFRSRIKCLGQAGTPEDPREIFKFYQNKVLIGYIPRQYPGRVTLFRSSEVPGKRSNDPTWGWSKVAEEVAVHWVPGDHRTVITKHVQILANKLRTCLDQAQAND